MLDNVARWIDRWMDGDGWMYIHVCIYYIHVHVIIYIIYYI